MSSIPIWSFFSGCSHARHNAQRVDGDTVVFVFEGRTYRIKVSCKADEHTALVAFDGFCLRHGLAGGTKVLGYEFQNTSYQKEFIAGPECIELRSYRNNISRASEYEPEDLRTLRDCRITMSWKGGDTLNCVCANIERSSRHFLSIPKRREGTKSLVCQLKPRSFERRYIGISVTYKEVVFSTQNTY